MGLAALSGLSATPAPAKRRLWTLDAEAACGVQGKVWDFERERERERQATCQRSCLLHVISCLPPTDGQRKWRLALKPGERKRQASEKERERETETTQPQTPSKQANKRESHTDLAESRRMTRGRGADGEPVARTRAGGSCQGFRLLVRDAGSAEAGRHGFQYVSVQRQTSRRSQYHCCSGAPEGVCGVTVLQYLRTPLLAQLSPSFNMKDGVALTRGSWGPVLLSLQQSKAKRGREREMKKQSILVTRGERMRA